MLQSTFTSMTTRPLPRWVLASRGSYPPPGESGGPQSGGSERSSATHRLCLLGRAALLGWSGLITDDYGRQRRPLATLALLARSGERGCTRERLAGLLWPEADEHRARHSLSEILHTIRRGLGDAAVVQVGERLGLSRAFVSVDTDQFEAALRSREFEQAVGLYGGPFLDGFSISGSQPFDEWMEGERQHLADCYAGVLDHLGAAATAAGDLPAAAGWWRQRLDHDPFCSHAAEALMDALAAGGDRAAAIQMMEAHLQRLRGELGVEPSPALQEAVRRLRAAGTSRQPATRPLDGGSMRPAVSDAGRLVPALAPDPVSADRAVPPGGLSEPAAHRNRRARRMLAGVTAGVVVVVVGAVSLSPLMVDRGALDPDLIAVPSFGLVGPEIEPYWAEGFAGLVAIKLDATGALRAHVVTGEVRGGRGRLAWVAGRQLGAGLVLVGTLAAEGPDSVALDAELYDVKGDRVVGKFALVAQRDRLNGLGNRFVQQVLARIDSIRAPDPP
jgi:DNA-binding SARP family transcriptional activator